MESNPKHWFRILKALPLRIAIEGAARPIRNRPGQSCGINGKMI
jgi:hypothetical protein